ncbi:MAG: hypothetical protein II811_06715, partial [Spirochaetaceae bacterium]|nr:hypothetical protein [Spirochaetaceae bacterium]
MSEHNYRDFWLEAMRQIREEYKAQGKEMEFQLWFNMEYVEDSFTTITVSVPSTFLWDQMLKKGHVRIVENRICALTGRKDIKITSVVKLQNSSIAVPVEEATEMQQSTAPAPSVPLQRAEPMQSEPKPITPPKDYPEEIPIFTALKEGFIEEEAKPVQNAQPLPSYSAPVQPRPAPQQNPPRQAEALKHPQLREDYTFEN